MTGRKDRERDVKKVDAYEEVHGVSGKRCIDIHTKKWNIKKKERKSMGFQHLLILITSILILLNSSKQAQAPHAAKPCGREKNEREGRKR